jgi:para-nitrobenzyl esterase
MFWIHGGGNSAGAATFYDPAHLAVSQNVIVVTTQYRLGPFGWFRHKALRAGETDAAAQSGNFGTLDLIRALGWVRDNISVFGGDSGNVTVFGESAGGFDVFSLLLSPLAKGLFHRAISESGGLSDVSTADAENFTDAPTPGQKQSSNEIVLRLLQRDGHAKDRASAKARLAAMTDAEVAAYLRSKPALDLLETYEFHKGTGLISMPLVFHDGTVLPQDSWLDRFADPNGWNRVPVIAGTNRDEAKLFMAFDPKRVWRLFGVFPKYVDEPSYHAAAEYLSRAWKERAADRPASAMVKSGATDVYVYRFDWHGEPTLAGTDLGKLLGAAHGLEIPFVFGRFDLGQLGAILFDKHGEADREQLSHAMMSYWAGFARSGRPTPRPAGELPEWKPWNDVPAAPKFLVLDTVSEGGIHPGTAAESRDRIIADIDDDLRLQTQADKCRVFHDLGEFSRVISKAEYLHIGRKGCADYPFEEIP